MCYLIRVPATSANLGPGFDCLGLALDFWNEIEVEATGTSLNINIVGEGAETLPTDEQNSIYQTMQQYAARHHKTLPQGLQITCRNRIPLGAGLGSSAAAIVGGILAATAVLKLPTNLEDQLDCATQIEGHPDNVAPCLLGGMVAAIVDQQKVVARRYEAAPLSLVLAVPYFPFPTKKSRASLPVDVSRQDAIFNLSRLVFLIEALQNGDINLLSFGMQDMLHQPYRIPLIPGATTAIQAAREAGAAAVVLSGAGPSLLAVLKSKDHEQQVITAMENAFQAAGLQSRHFTPGISHSGAFVINL